MARTRLEDISDDENEKNTDTSFSLDRHIEYFGADGQVSYNSMVDKLKQLGETEEEAKSTANKVSLVGGVLISGCPYSTFSASQAATKLRHGRDTTIYAQDRSVDEKAWKELLTYSEKLNGVRIITEPQFYAFLQKKRDEDPSYDILGLAKGASDGEWSKFWKMCTEGWKVEGDNQVPYVTRKTLRDFFVNSANVFDKVIGHTLPASRPGK